MVVIAITGSPGVGKTTISNMLASQGWKVNTVAELAKTFDCEGDYDELMGCVEIDIHKLAERFLMEPNDNLIIEGHLAHFLAVDAIVILRCEPSQLRARLESRGYTQSKINANLEWELIAGTWSEIVEFDIDVPILELDSSTLSAEELIKRLLDWIDGDFKHNSTIISNAIDWLGK
tara:strand:- start:879 stop:1406 length:528 start_codon:yes stop_codon:yes gene_type:complete